MSIGTEGRGGGVSGFGVAEEGETPLSGTGGAAGPGTRAGEGEPSGEGIARRADIGDGENLALNRDIIASGEIDGCTGEEAAREAAALGNLDDHDETPALEYGEADRPRGPTIGEALGSGAGTHVGSGTDPDRSGLGSGGPFGNERPRP